MTRVLCRLTVAASFVAVTFAGGAAAQVAPAAPRGVAIADWTIAPVLDVRTRAEVRHDLDDRDRSVLFERSRVGADGTRGDLRARVVLQDGRLVPLGQSPDAVEGPSPVAMTGAYEAWVEAHTASVRPSFVRLGRQAITWGEGRLLGASDWSVGRSLDAFRGRLVVGDGSAEVLAATLGDAPTTGAPFAVAPYGEVFGARVEWAFDPLFAVEGYALARLAQANPSDPKATLEGTLRGQTYTAALRFAGDSQGWNWGAEGAYQFGSVDVWGATRAAWAAAAHVARAFEHVALSPSVRVGAAFASGGRPVGGGATYHAFDPLAPDVHAWHGAMDAFSWSNEAEASARVFASPWTDGAAAIEYRYARLADRAGSWRSGYLTTIGQVVGNGSSELGHEVDAMVSWSPWEAVEVAAEYSILVLGDGARVLAAARGRAATLSQFAAASARVTFF